MTTFSPPATSGLYDPIPARRRHDAPAAPTAPGGTDASMQQLPPPAHAKPWHGPEDSLSDVSTSDSGRGGSDVELASQAASRNSADGSFSSGRPFYHNNLSVGRRQDAPTAAATHVNIPVEAAGGGVRGSTGSAGRGYRSVHFQAPPPALATFQPRASATPSPSHSHDDDASSIYVKLANHRQQQQQQQHPPTSHASSGGYLEMRPRPAWGAPPAAHGPPPQLDVTLAEVDEGADARDDTTTSGSYTVDASELCHEIDQLFFQGPPSKDVVV